MKRRILAGVGCLVVAVAATGCSISSTPSEVVGPHATFGQVFNACQNIEDDGDNTQVQIQEFKACMATADKLLTSTTTTEGDK